MAKKSLEGYIWNCELKWVLKKENECIKIDDNFAPTTKRNLLDGVECGCPRKKHPIQKVRVNIETI